MKTPLPGPGAQEPPSDTPPKGPLTPSAEMVGRLAEAPPTIADLSEVELSQLGRAVVLRRRLASLNARVLAAKYNRDELAQTFLVGQRSDRTAKVYRQALAKLFQWSELTQNQVIGLTPGQADQFVTDLRLGGKLSDQTLKTVADSLSAWYTWLHRRHPELTNPFRGSRARPRIIKQTPWILTDDDLQVVFENTAPADAAAVAVLAYRGIPVGGLANLQLHGQEFVIESIGLKGSLPPAAMGRLTAAELDPVLPFAFRQGLGWSNRLTYLFRRLKKQGLLASVVSPQDLKHYFVVRQYSLTKDLVSLKILLGHASILDTQAMIRRLGLS